jgi:hypothetical protein
VAKNFQDEINKIYDDGVDVYRDQKTFAIEFVHTFMTHLGFSINFVKTLHTTKFLEDITREMIIDHMPEANLDTPYTDVRCNHGGETCTWEYDKLNQLEKSELIELFMSVIKKGK